MDYILERLTEPSTFAGIASVLASFGLFGFTPADWNVIFGAVASVAGAFSVFMKERK